MKNTKRLNGLASIIFAAAFALTLTACAPEVGSEQWCSDMKAKSKADWTGNQTADFAKHCIFK